MTLDFSCEEKLMNLNSELHKRYCDSLFATVKVLSNYRAIFPDYTDHSYLHTMNVLNYCNQLIGENIYTLNCGEIYVLMMAAALHDTGMGISKDDYKEFISQKQFKEYLSQHQDSPLPESIRDLHHELSGCFIRKYSMLFEIPEEFVFPIVQAARGHRKTDLYSQIEYPDKYVAGKYTICLPYIAALIRIADELDIAAERNIQLDRTIDEIKNDYSISVWKLHSKIKDVILTEKRCIVLVDKKALSGSDMAELENWLKKLRYTFAYTSDVTSKRTGYKLWKRIVSREYV